MTDAEREAKLKQEVEAGVKKMKKKDGLAYVADANTMVERLLIAGMLTSNTVFDEVIASGITHEDFTNQSCRLLAKVLFDYYAETGARPDFAIAADRAQKAGVWNRMGGQPFFAEVLAPYQGDLLEYGIISTQQHIRILKESSNRRRIYNAASKIAASAYRADKNLHEIVEYFDKITFDTIEKVTNTTIKNNAFPVVVENAMKRVEWAWGQDSDWFAGFKSGYSDLDEIIGAFAPGTLNILAARPSMGKSALALNFIWRGVASNPDLPVVLFSLEMTVEQIIHRFLSMATKISLLKIRRAIMNASELSLLWTMSKSIGEMKIIVEDEPDLTTTKFRSLCRRYKRKHGGIALIIVDYLQLLATEKDYHGNRVNEVSEISKELKAAAVELDCPVLALSQLSRETEKRNEKKPKLSDLRDSGSIEQDADTVTLLYREDYYADEKPKKDSILNELDDVAELNVAKNRNGPIGKCRLLFHREFTSFEAMN